jgi:cell division protein FtsI (penicillin-binding protein 3)
VRKMTSYASPCRHPGRINALRIIGLLFFFLIGVRLVAIQVLWSDVLVQRADRHGIRAREVVAPRGHIVDRHGNLLAVELCRMRDLRVDALKLRDTSIRGTESTRQRLAEILNMPMQELDAHLARGNRDYLLKARLEESQAREIDQANLMCVNLKRQPRRVYPQESLAGNVLGGLNRRHEPVGGVEAAWDSVLCGQQGKEYFVCDPNREPYRPAHRPRLEAVPGKNLRLFLDLRLQSVAQEELALAIDQYEAVAGQVLVLDPAKGEILAMVSLPSLDPNHMAEWKPDHARVRSITDIYEPGSTLKLITYAAALENGWIDDFDEKVYCHNGQFRVHGIPIRDSNRRGYDTLSVGEIFTNSSNIGTAILAQRMEKEQLYIMARNFGLGQMMGMDLQGEVAGQLPPLAKWGPVEFVNIAMGQGVAVTPLQVACAFGTVVNDGLLMRPRLIDQIESAQEARRSESLPIRRVMSSKTASRLRDLLIQTVEDGTGQAAAVEGLIVGGKTGTAQKVDKETGRYSNKDYMSSFVGFAEIGQRQLVCLVILDTPRGQVYGGTVAAPVFRKVMERAMHLEHEQQKGAGPLYWSQTKTDPVMTTRASADEHVLPELENLPLASALSRLSALGRAPQIQGRGGRVVKQVPAAGSNLHDVSQVLLVLGDPRP